MGDTFDKGRFRSARAKWKPVVDSVLGQATELMLDCAGLTVGTSVLDVGAGAGGQTVLAAGRVGPKGRVAATDIAPEMLEVASEDVRSLGFTNVEFRAMGAEELDFDDDSFDAAISRNVLMYVRDLRCALGSIYRVLKPHGRMSSVMWSTPERNGFLSVFHSVLSEHVRAAGITMAVPDPFRFGESASLLTALAEAGFVNARVQKVQASWRLPSLSAALAFLKENPNYLAREVEKMGEVDRAAAWEAIRAEYKKFETPEGFVAPAELLVVSAEKP